MKSGLGIGMILLIIVVIVGVGFGICGLCWEYTINTWMEHFDKPGRIEFWQAGLLGIVPAIGQLSVPGAVLTWVIIGLM